MKKIVSIVLAAVLLISTQVSFSQENANTKRDLSSKKVEKFLTDHDVPTQKMKVLLNKYDKGELWDCQKAEKLQMVPESFYIFDPFEGSETRFFRFEDGSFIKIQSEQLEEQEISGDSKSLEFLESKGFDNKSASEIVESVKSMRGSSDNETNGVEHGSGYAWYYDHKVSYTSFGQYAEMYADFVISQHTADSIKSCYWPTVRGFGQLNGYPKTTVERATEDIQRGKWALAATTWVTNYSISTPWGGSTGSGTYYLWLGVGNNKYRVGPTLPY